MGRSPPPFDLLYWNADATNMPAAVHTWVMRNLYLENRLRQPGGVTLAGEAIDVTRVTTPTYVLSASEDHIAPWRTTYETTQLFSGPVKFVLSGSGHIAGVINPPHKKKYHYWSNAKTPAEAEAWLTGARCEEGSWWPDWKRWLSRQAGGRAPARIPGNGGLGVIEDAPGGYVKARTG
jgi:polyhydroxyalkanoate synthase